MAGYTDFVVAVDLGTSHLTGIVGRRNESGKLNVLARETEEGNTGIRRGCVFNIGETAAKLSSLVRKLESRLEGGRIAKVYIGVGGQSVRAIDHVVSHELGNGEEEVTEEVLDLLHEACRAYKPEGLDVLDIVPPAYRVDGKKALNPVGVPCRNIEAHFKLIVGRPSLRKHVLNVAERAHVRVAGIVISPLMQAEAVLTDNEKELGCALVDFGAGVTSLTIYKGGRLQFLNVIPLGARLITRDLTGLNLVEAEAERVKVTYGAAEVDKEDTSTVQVNGEDSTGLSDIRLMDINTIVEARAKEILENVLVRLERPEVENMLGGGVIITGGGANLRKVAELMKKRLKREMRFATLRKGLFEQGAEAGDDPTNAVAVGILMLPDAENCARRTAPPVAAPQPAAPQPSAVPPPVRSTPPVQKNNPAEKKKKEAGKMKDTLKGWMGGLFSDEQM
ncbi:MAG: cell division protein FtsA [Tannerellaceae bacterium]|jgi:cell division protein FtsA|nr:cell division protein FtsA [Tannerellaceae bacterium]